MFYSFLRFSVIVSEWPHMSDPCSISMSEAHLLNTLLTTISKFGNPKKFMVTKILKTFLCYLNRNSLNLGQIWLNLNVMI